MMGQLSRTLPPTMALAVALAAAGCGLTASHRSPTLDNVPLTTGTRVVTHVRRCDRGANPYCAVQLVVVGTRFTSSGALLASENRQLRSVGWTPTGVDTGVEHAADSPDHKLRLTYAIAALDLKGIDMGWVQRAPSIGLSLSRTMFARAPALSLMLETGSS